MILTEEIKNYVLIFCVVAFLAYLLPWLREQNKKYKIGNLLELTKIAIQSTEQNHKDKTGEEKKKLVKDYIQGKQRIDDQELDMFIDSLVNTLNNSLWNKTKE